MQAVRNSEPFSLLEYQSREPRVFGIELRPIARNGVQGLLAGLRWIGRSEAFREQLTFLVINLPERIASREITQVAQCAMYEGLSRRLCAVVSPGTHRLAATIDLLQRNNIAVLLGGVGKHSRFSDIADHPLSGVVIDHALMALACGDPHAASILDAILTLANSLGLKSFARECATKSEFNFALSAGVSYVAYGELTLEAAAASLPDIGRSVETRRGSSLPHHGRPS